MNASELKRFRGLLDEKREALRRQLTDLGADPDEDRLEGLGFDSGFADSAQATAERAKVFAVVERLRDDLTEVEEALERVDRGGYGICQSCGEPISPERLEARPGARLCVSCKQKESA